MFESKEIGKGIYGILLASPLSDAVAGIVIITMTVYFFKNLGVEKEKEIRKEKYAETIKRQANGLLITLLGYVKGTEKSKN